MKARKLSLAALVCCYAALAFAAPPTADAGTRPHFKIGSVRVATKAAPLALSVKAHRNDELGLRVNGKHVHDAFDFKGRRTFAAQLSGSDGVEPGINRLRIRAEHAGRSNAKSLTIRVPRKALWADAGNDVGMTTSAPTELGAKPAGPSATPGLRYRWRILRSPDGSDATLTHRHEAQPVINTSVPGTYKLRLKAHRKGRSGVSHDTLTVPVSPDDPPIGAPINTLGPDGAITIDGKSYGASSDDTKLAYVVMERTTRTVVLDDKKQEVAGSVSGDPTGLAKLADIAKKYSEGDNSLRYLMIVSGRHPPTGTSTSFTSFLGQLGVPPLTREQFSALSLRPPFSVIGIPGAPPGGATYRIPPEAAVNPAGAITGYLQKNQAIGDDGTKLYDYASSEHPAFDTRASGSDDTSNVMTVGDARYQASFADSGYAHATGGLHMVMLDSQTLALLDNRILVTNAGDTQADRHLQLIIGDFLHESFDKYGDPIVLVQSVGKVKAAGPEWQRVVDELARAGANPLYVNALDGTSQYALVGRVKSSQPPVEASTASARDPRPTYPPARLVGILARDRSSTFGPSIGSIPAQAIPDRSINIELTQLAYQTPRPWPAINADAENYICKQLGFCQAASSCPDLRSCYWQKYRQHWDTISAQLNNNVSYPAESHPPFSEDDFTKAKKELIKEMLDVSIVTEYIDDLQKPFLKVEGRTQIDLEKIGKDIYESVQPPPDKETGISGLGIVGKALLLGTFAGPKVSPFTSGLSAAFGLAAYLSNSKGQPILGAEIKTKADALRTELPDRFDLASQELLAIRLLIVSDWGKLEDAERHIKSNWGLEDTAPESALRTASQQQFYESLIPVAYPDLIQGNVDRPVGLYSGGDAQSFFCWPGQPDDAQVSATAGYDASGNAIKNRFFFTRGWGWTSPPTDRVFDGLFKPRNQGGLGVEKLSFFTPRIFGGVLFRATNGVSACGVGFLPFWK